MSRNPAKKIISAAILKFPSAKLTAATKFTTRPRNVKKLGFTPVAARTPTILSSSHLLPVPIAPVKVAILLLRPIENLIFSACLRNRTLGLQHSANECANSDQIGLQVSRFVLDHALLTAYIHFTSFAIHTRIYGKQPLTPRIFVSDFNGVFGRLGFRPLARHAFGGHPCTPGRPIHFTRQV